MGGCCCCCASKGLELNSAPPFYHYQTVSEERQPLSHQGTVPTLSTGCLVNTNLETSIPDTYISPPTPIPYDASLGHPRIQSANQESRGNKNEAAVQAANNVPVGETHTGSTEVADLKESDCKVQTNIELTVSKELEDEKSDELKRSSEPLDSALEEEEDVCPTCLEEYDADNPKIITKCEHHFHLSCILEWMERSDTCPVCDKEMIFSPLVDTQLSA